MLQSHRRLPVEHKVFANWLYAKSFETPHESTKYMSQLLEFDDQVPLFHYQLGIDYMDMYQYDKAEEYYRQALSLEPERPVGLNSLAYFLIDNNRNINEGMELVEKALAINPDYYIPDTKGWGLFKLGKYKESLELLEKAWELKPLYDHGIYLHLQEARKAVAGQR